MINKKVCAIDKTNTFLTVLLVFILERFHCKWAVQCREYLLMRFVSIRESAERFKLWQIIFLLKKGWLFLFLGTDKNIAILSN
jgi:hypothetical protein